MILLLQWEQKDRYRIKHIIFMEKSRDIRREPEMENIITSKFFNTILLLTIIGEFFLPWILGKYYDGYNSKTMIMSALGSPQSPVRVIYNTWLIWLGLFFTFVAIAYFLTARIDFPILSVLLLISIGLLRLEQD